MDTTHQSFDPTSGGLPRTPRHYLLSRLTPADRLLDVGIGPGTITVDFAGLLYEGSVVGIDRAPAAVATARTLATARQVRNLRLLVGDVYHLGFADDSFDVVHAHQLLQHLAEPVTALREMRRVCAAGGFVAARDADYAAMTWHPPSAALVRWLALYHQVARANGGEPDAGRRLLVGRMRLVSAASTHPPAPGALLHPRTLNGGPTPGQSG